MFAIAFIFYRDNFKLNNRKFSKTTFWDRSPLKGRDQSKISVWLLKVGYDNSNFEESSWSGLKTICKPKNASSNVESTVTKRLVLSYNYCRTSKLAAFGLQVPILKLKKQQKWRFNWIGTLGKPKNKQSLITSYFKLLNIIPTRALNIYNG